MERSTLHSFAALGIVLAALAVTLLLASYSLPAPASAWNNPHLLTSQSVPWLRALLLILLPPGFYALLRHWQLHPLAAFFATLLWAFTLARALTVGLPFGSTGLTPPSPWWEHAYAAPYILLRHLAMWLWPFGDDVPLRVNDLLQADAQTVLLAGLFYWLVLAIVLRTIWRLRKRLPLMARGLGFALVSLIPVSGIVPLPVAPLSEYYLLLPALGLSVGVASLLQQTLAAAVRIKGPRRAVPAVLATLLALWIGANLFDALSRTAAVSSPTTRIREAAARQPTNYAILTELARYEARAGNLYRAEEILAGRGGYPGVIGAAPWYPEVHIVHAEALWRLG